MTEQSASLAIIAVVGTLITAVAAGYNTLQTRLAKRDQLQTDAKIISLEGDLKGCLERHAVADERLEECHNEHKKSEEDRSKLWEHVMRLQKFVHSPDEDREAGVGK